MRITRWNCLVFVMKLRLNLQCACTIKAAFANQLQYNWEFGEERLTQVVFGQYPQEMLDFTRLSFCVFTPSPIRQGLEPGQLKSLSAGDTNINSASPESFYSSAGWLTYFTPTHKHFQSTLTYTHTQAHIWTQNSRQTHKPQCRLWHEQQTNTRIHMNSKSILTTIFGTTSEVASLFAPVKRRDNILRPRLTKETNVGKTCFVNSEWI